LHRFGVERRARATARARRKILFHAHFPIQNEVSRALCLGGSVNQKLAIVAQLLEPADDIAGLIMNQLLFAAAVTAQFAGLVCRLQRDPSA
jgi:hypothetical protein